MKFSILTISHSLAPAYRYAYIKFHACYITSVFSTVVGWYIVFVFIWSTALCQLNARNYFQY